MYQRKTTELLAALLAAGAALLTPSALAADEPAPAQTDQAQQATPPADAQPPGVSESTKKRQDIYTSNVDRQMTAMEQWVHDVKHPVEWFEWGADVRLRHIYAPNNVTLNASDPNNLNQFERFRFRAWATLKPTEYLDLHVKLTSEPRHWHKPDSREEWQDAGVVFDNLYVKVKDIADTGLTFTGGRQNIILGKGWLVLDGTPLDGSRTIYFDAARATFNWDEMDTTIDAIYIDQAAGDDAWLRPINPQEVNLIEQNERAAVLYAVKKWFDANDPDQKKVLTQLDAYAIYKHEDAVQATGRDGEVYTLGGAIAHALTNNLGLRVEGAYQFGSNTQTLPFGVTVDGDIQAFGTKAGLTYDFHDDWKTSVHVTGEFLSGDDPDTRTVESFTSLWGRWPQFSELYVYPYATETRIADVTNLIRANVGVHTYPIQGMQLCLDYHALWAMENTMTNAALAGGFSNGGKFRGHLLAAVVKHKFNAHVSGHIVGEVFFPGDYYADERNDIAAFVRVELLLTF